MSADDDMVIPIVRAEAAADLPYPDYATEGASGVDLRAAVTEPVWVRRGEIVLVPTGIALALPNGIEAQVRARSGLALRHGITLVNGPGTIDADYRGEIGVILSNLKDEPFLVERGMRIAQLVFAPVLRVRFAAVADLELSERGAGGFGHTGVG